MGLELQLLISLNRSINRIHQSEEPRHRRQQLLLEQGNLLFPIGVIDPGPGDQEPFGGVSGEQPLHSPITGLHQTNRILGSIPQNMRSHDDLTPYGAGTGRLQDRSASQRGILEVPGAALLVGRLELVGCIWRVTPGMTLSSRLRNLDGQPIGLLHRKASPTVLMGE